MMRKLGQISGAAVLGCLLCLVLCCSGAFAQSARYDTVNNAAQSITAHVQQGARPGIWNGGWYGRSGHFVRTGWRRAGGWGRTGWYGGRTGWYGHGYSSGGFTRFVRVTRMIRVTQIIRVTQVRFIRVTHFIRQTLFRSVSGCGGGC